MSLKTTRTEIEPTIFVSLSQRKRTTNPLKEEPRLADLKKKKTAKKKEKKKSTKRQREEAR